MPEKHKRDQLVKRVHAKRSRNVMNMPVQQLAVGLKMNESGRKFARITQITSMTPVARLICMFAANLIKINLTIAYTRIH